MKLQRFTCEIDSPLGTLRLVASDSHLTHLLWPDHEPAPSFSAETAHGHPLLVAATTQLADYFDGKRRDFDLPLDPAGTEFQRQAWTALQTIPFGKTRTYSEQAKSIGRPSAVRAIGAANGRNPISIIIPCHRVIGANGTLTGYAGGLDIKRWLLTHEGIL